MGGLGPTSGLSALMRGALSAIASATRLAKPGDSWVGFGAYGQIHCPLVQLDFGHPAYSKLRPDSV